MHQCFVGQVCVDPHTTDLSMTLLAFAAERRAAGRPPLSVDMSRPQGQQQQTRRTLLQRVNGTDGRTDTVSLHRPCRVVCGNVNNCSRGSTM